MNYIFIKLSVSSLVLEKVPEKPQKIENHNGENLTESELKLLADFLVEKNI
jgi:hypothetical protein